MRKEIKVLNYNFQIKEVPLIDLSSQRLGQVNHITQIIEIRSDLCEERKKVVLIHEILHSVLEQLGFNELHDNEQFVTAVSMALAQVIEDNREKDEGGQCN